MARWILMQKNKNPCIFMMLRYFSQWVRILSSIEFLLTFQAGCFILHTNFCCNLR